MGKTKVIISVDTEISTYLHQPLNIDNMIYGKIDGGYYGIDRIMELCDEKGFKATFFVDVYACKSVGEKAMREVCLKIKSAGHDVQLHTHPYVYDIRRYSMNDYSLDEQKNILNEGRELLYKWTGEYPIAHRAGDFGANYDTLEALAATGFSVDSSMLYKWPYCMLNQPLLTKNAQLSYKGILEIPVSVYAYFSIGNYELCRAFDVDANTSVELRKALLSARRLNINPVMTMMHSFSFISWSRDRTKYTVDRGDIMRFECLLEFLAGNKDFEVVTIKEYYEGLKEHDKEKKDVPEVLPFTGLRYALWRVVIFRNKSWKNFIAFSGICIMALFCIVLAWKLFH